MSRRSRPSSAWASAPEPHSPSVSYRGPNGPRDPLDIRENRRFQAGRRRNGPKPRPDARNRCAQHSEQLGAYGGGHLGTWARELDSVMGYYGTTGAPHRVQNESSVQRHQRAEIDDLDVYPFAG